MQRKIVCLQLKLFSIIPTVPTQISILEPLVGKSGWLSVSNFTINSFETEDHLLLCGIGDDGIQLGTDQCQRLFSIPGQVRDAEIIIDNHSKDQLNSITHRLEKDTLRTNAERNAAFFEIEMDKLDKWAEDIKNSLELQLKQLDQEIKARQNRS